MVQADLSDEASASALIPEVSSRLGAPSCVVNNASLFDFDNVASFTFARLDAHMHANLGTPILLGNALHADTLIDAPGSGVMGCSSCSPKTAVFRCPSVAPGS